ncbi:MAG: OmpA family protein [Rubritepida sp.]|nr:OmpA family protein [Rubritepida sp.]
MIRRHFLQALPALALTGCVSPSREPPAIVFFEADSAALAGPGTEIVRRAATVAARHPGAVVRVLGFADTDGSRRFSQALSRARAEHVADLLRQAGVAGERIRVSARGPVAFEMAEQESRRVEIHLGE